MEGLLGEWPLAEDCVEHRSFPRFIFLIIKFLQGNLSRSREVLKRAGRSRESRGESFASTSASGQRIPTQTLFENGGCLRHILSIEMYAVAEIP